MVVTFEDVQTYLEAEIKRLEPDLYKQPIAPYLAQNIKNANKELTYDEVYSLCEQAINEFKELEAGKQQLLLAFIESNYRIRKTINKDVHSYELKHHFEHWRLGSYITNEQFKGAMLVCGYVPYDITSKNWRFNIVTHKRRPFEAI